eukprot:6960978-Alexandrium_andersonii.AAC.1
MAALSSASLPEERPSAPTGSAAKRARSVSAAVTRTTSAATSSASAAAASSNAPAEAPQQCDSAG